MRPLDKRVELSSGYQQKNKTGGLIIPIKDWTLDIEPRKYLHAFFH